MVLEIVKSYGTEEDFDKLVQIMLEAIKYHLEHKEKGH